MECIIVNAPFKYANPILRKALALKKTAIGHVVRPNVKELVPFKKEVSYFTQRLYLHQFNMQYRKHADQFFERVSVEDGLFVNWIKMGAIEGLTADMEYLIDKQLKLMSLPTAKMVQENNTKICHFVECISPLAESFLQSKLEMLKRQHERIEKKIQHMSSHRVILEMLPHGCEDPLKHVLTIVEREWMVKEQPTESSS